MPILTTPRTLTNRWQAKTVAAVVPEWAASTTYTDYHYDNFMPSCPSSGAWLDANIFYRSVILKQGLLASPWRRTWEGEAGFPHPQGPVFNS